MCHLSALPKFTKVSKLFVNSLHKLLGLSSFIAFWIKIVNNLLIKYTGEERWKIILKIHNSKLSLYSVKAGSEAQMTKKIAALKINSQLLSSFYM